MEKWIRFEKSDWGLSASVIIFNKVVLYAGQTDHWGISIDFNFYDRALTFEILNLYAGIQVYHSH